MAGSEAIQAVGGHRPERLHRPGTHETHAAATAEPRATRAQRVLKNAGARSSALALLAENPGTFPRSALRRRSLRPRPSLCELCQPRIRESSVATCWQMRLSSRCIVKSAKEPTDCADESSLSRRRAQARAAIALLHWSRRNHPAQMAHLSLLSPPLLPLRLPCLRFPFRVPRAGRSL